MKNELPIKRIFTPGPVKMSPLILKIGALQPPYFRNQAFSELVLNCEAKLLTLVNAPADSRVIFLTASGTAAMEAVVMNILDPTKAAAVVNGGSFGQRFVDICCVHGIPIMELKVDRDTLSDRHVLQQSLPADVLLINGHETSIGHLYDLNYVGCFCKQHDMLHAVDAISMFVTDPLDMQDQNIDVLILSSHKGLALPPGMAFVVLTPTALSRLNPSKSFYFDFNKYLQDGTRGQTPFTPAVSIFFQLHARLEQLTAVGLPSEWRRVAELASYFRKKIAKLPLEPYSRNMPNAMTTLRITNGISAFHLVNELEKKHKCVVAPNSGTLKETVFRVSHMGHMTFRDVDMLTKALTRFFMEHQ